MALHFNIEFLVMIIFFILLYIEVFHDLVKDSLKTKDHRSPGVVFLIVYIAFMILLFFGLFFAEYDHTIQNMK